MLIIETIITDWEETPVIIYPPSYVSDSVKIGKDTKIGAFADISKNTEIGRGNNIQHRASIPSDTKIGDGNFIGPCVEMFNDKFMNSVINAPVIGNHNRIGGGVTILPGVTIGDNCFICAGAMITKDVPAGTIIKPKKKERVIW